jgi:hypothetical protein
MTSPMVVPVDVLVCLAALGIGCLSMTLWAIIDAATTPNELFVAAGSSKRRWIAGIAILYTATVIVGVILALGYLLRVRPRLRAIDPR